MNKSLISLIVLVSTLSAATAVMAEPPAPEVSLEGLELVDKDRRGWLYADPEIDWSVYTAIQLDPATVAFRKNWQRDQNRYQPFKVKASDMERIKSNLSELFGEVFSEELTTDGGYRLAAESADNVMRITPRIIDLDVYAPDTRTAVIQQSYTRQAGEMTLKLDIYDSVTGDLIASISDRRESTYRGYMQWTTSVSNRADARRMLQSWATELRKRLDKARATSN